jgi:formiminoglutamate deiminase
VSARYWCEQCWLGGEQADSGVLLELDGEHIASVRRAATAPADATRLAGLTLPGLANAHSHAFQRALRSRTQGGTGNFWTWREQMYGLAATIDPDRYRALARATFAEMALAGITLVGEFHYLHHDPDGRPYDDPNEMGNVIIEAARAAGLRLTLLDTCYLHGGIGEPLAGAQRRFGDRDAEAWAGRAGALAGGAAARIGAAIHSVRAVTPQEARVVADWAAERSAPLHAHVSEQPAENEACLAAHGLTPTALLASADAIGERFTAVHATHLAPTDVVLLGEARATCCLCPTTERDLADGVGPARELVDAGASLALGSDSQAVIDHFEEARAVELDERLVTRERGRHSPRELAYAASRGGYRSLGWDEGGRVEPGALADLTTVSLASVRTAGAGRDDALAAALYAASAADVTHVIVGGREIVSGGRHVELDVAAELASSIEKLRR